MNGAESLLQTLVGCGVEVCFTNPGTSEMHFVAALDKQDGMRSVLGLFEGVVTGAADGYARMAGKPACTLLHLGPGLANGLANLHNARRARVPLVNVVGDHATYHRHLDAPLTSNIERFRRAGLRLDQGVRIVAGSRGRRRCSCGRGHDATGTDRNADPAGRYGMGSGIGAGETGCRAATRHAGNRGDRRGGRALRSGDRCALLMNGAAL